MIANTSTKSTERFNMSLFLHGRKEPVEIAAHDSSNLIVGSPRRAQRLQLRVADSSLPSSREERRVGSEEHAVRAGDLQRTAEHIRQRQPRMITHPAVRAR